MPNEIVDTGTFASAALRAAVNAPRGSFSPSGPGTVCLPSVISTIRAGGGPSWVPEHATWRTSRSSAAPRRSPRRSRCAPSSCSPSIGPLDRRAVGGRRHQHGRGAGERHQPEVHPRGQLVDELLRRLLRGGQPVGRHVGGLHRQRHVDHQHDRRPVARLPASAVGPASATVSSISASDQQRAAGRCRQRPGRSGRDPLQQLQVREPQRVAGGVRRCSDEVADRQGRRRRRAAASHHGVGEVHQASPGSGDRRACRSAATHGPATLAARATNRTTSATQSRSVRSTRCAAPHRRSATRHLGRGARPRPRRTPGAAAAWSRPRAGRPVSGSSRIDQCRRRAAPGRAGRAPRRRAARAAPDSARSGRSQLELGPRKSEITTARPRRRGGRRSCSSATARSPRVPTGARGVRGEPRSSMPRRARSPPRAGTRRSARAGGDHRADPVAAAAGQVGDGRGAATTRSRFSQPVVPKSRQADRSTPARSPAPGRPPSAACAAGRPGGDRPVHPAHVVAGLVEPGLPGSVPGPGTSPRWLPCSSPSSRRRTVSSSVPAPRPALAQRWRRDGAAPALRARRRRRS